MTPLHNTFYKPQKTSKKFSRNPQKTFMHKTLKKSSKKRQKPLKYSQKILKKIKKPVRFYEMTSRLR
jgi:hypothetical protein